MLAKGCDIPDAEELLRALTETNTTVKLLFVKSEDVEEAIEKIPKLIPAVPGTMRSQQVITLAPGELMVRDVSYMCTIWKQFNCKCFSTLFQFWSEDGNGRQWGESRKGNPVGNSRADWEMVYSNR
ncbi:hypothetical protein GBF38_005733 [Nibea albiflora]|uniref:Uncharacterized protein n=1 Tax=Nibea albiflora TaxID=240163 RepID=A0ACB7F9D0_NIBAL|nr:hypothetical protein GBF38_005733 [Nibea albiflora]